MHLGDVEEANYIIQKLADEWSELGTSGMLNNCLV